MFLVILFLVSLPKASVHFGASTQCLKWIGHVGIIFTSITIGKLLTPFPLLGFLLLSEEEK